MRKCCLRTGGPLLAAAALSFIPVTTADARTPALLWQGASAIRVQCLVAPGDDPAARPLQEALCARVVKAASAGAPVPVSAIGFGDPEILAPGTIALLVHGHVEREGARALLAFSIRPYRNSADQTAILFGAPPRAASLSAAGAPTQALDAAIDAALRETLPWQSRPQVPRLIEQRTTTLRN